MGPLVAACAVTVILIGIGFALLFGKLASPGKVDEFPPDWLAEEPAAKYRPMERLLNDADFEFVASYTALPAKVSQRLRAERRRIFRVYLRLLRRDFGRIYTATKLLILYSDRDRPDLAAELMRQRMRFAYGMLLVECRLALHTVGVGTVDVRPLVAGVEAMRLQLQDFATPAPVPSAA